MPAAGTLLVGLAYWVSFSSALPAFLLPSAPRNTAAAYDVATCASEKELYRADACCGNATKRVYSSPKPSFGMTPYTDIIEYFKIDVSKFPFAAPLPTGDSRTVNNLEELTAVFNMMIAPASTSFLTEWTFSYSTEFNSIKCLRRIKGSTTEVYKEFIDGYAGYTMEAFAGFTVAYHMLKIDFEYIYPDTAAKARMDDLYSNYVSPMHDLKMIDVVNMLRGLTTTTLTLPDGSSTTVQVAEQGYFHNLYLGASQMTMYGKDKKPYGMGPYN